jgi:4-hydroxythreonine-4-phosphate dehydrogenase
VVKGSGPIAITMGDGAGIGPEIIVRAAAAGAFDRPVVVLGSVAVMKRAVRLLKAAIEIEPVEAPEQVRDAPGVLPVIDCSGGAPVPDFGQVSGSAGQTAYDAIVAAADLAMAGRVAAVVTAPIHKEALAMAGVRHPGHTEILAERAGVPKVAMMMANNEIRTVLVTIHLSLRDAIAHADFEAQLSAIRLADRGCRNLGIARPRVAVAGLNPHAGEGGLFGSEEIEIIAPAIAAARAEGIDATGPWPGDTVFTAARKGRFDVVVAQYHDQGLIPVKYLGFESGVNITLGLPFIRTSPDHGTAFDIAGKGEADPASLIAAYELARQLATTGREWES